MSYQYLQTTFNQGGINLKMHLQVLTEVFNDSVVWKLEM